MFNFIEKNKIPLVLLNARLTKKTFNRWMKVKNFTKTKVFIYAFCLRFTLGGTLVMVLL